LQYNLACFPSILHLIPPRRPRAMQKLDQTAAIFGLDRPFFSS